MKSVKERISLFLWFKKKPIIGKVSIKGNKDINVDEIIEQLKN